MSGSFYPKIRYKITEVPPEIKPCISFIGRYFFSEILLPIRSARDCIKTDIPPNPSENARAKIYTRFPDARKLEEKKTEAKLTSISGAMK